ncbi:hypothetical protein Tco_1465335 [Tanacetum coccineum]
MDFLSTANDFLSRHKVMILLAKNASALPCLQLSVIVDPRFAIQISGGTSEDLGTSLVMKYYISFRKLRDKARGIHPNSRGYATSLYGSEKCCSPVCWAEVLEQVQTLLVPELVQETTERIIPDQNKKDSNARARQKSTPNLMRLESLLTSLRFSELSGSNNKLSCISNFEVMLFLTYPISRSVGRIQVDASFICEEPIEIMGWFALKSKPIEAKPCPNCSRLMELRRGPEFTWEREDQLRMKYHTSLRKTSTIIM